jgi:GNAT superfamily N-acetyltransferase
MPIEPGLTISRARAEDFAEMDALREAIGWPPGSWFFLPILESAGILPVVRDANGTLVGLGAAFGRGGFESRAGADADSPHQHRASLIGAGPSEGLSGFIGNMVVHPAYQRRGIGTMVFEHLLEWFERLHVTSIQLEATPEGRPLYERYGFKPRWESITGVVTRVPEMDAAAVVESVTPEDWPAVAALAARAYGEDREPLLRAIAALPETVESVVLREGGNVTAFAVRRPNRVGPLCAEEERAAERLARVLLNRGGEGTRVPAGHPMHAAFWTRLGVDIEPNDDRMWMGDEPTDNPAQLFAMLNGGVG